MEDEDCSQ